jgi:cyclophilin family peptidyl-prolyl cis-trans isomerase
MLYLLVGCGAMLGLCALSMVQAGPAADAPPVVVIDTSEGPITIELNPAKAPITVENFLKYVDSGFYDNLIFHRVMDGFMIQGGGMDEKLNEKPTRAPIKNESKNGLSNKRGTIAMARTNDPDSATAQFYINLVDNAQGLDYPNARGAGYAVFGKVIAGQETVDKIGKTSTGRRGGMSDVPVKPITIKSIKRKPVE